MQELGKGLRDQTRTPQTHEHHNENQMFKISAFTLDAQSELLYLESMLEGQKG